MFTLVIRREPVTFRRPAVMGIINATPDSFYAPSRSLCEAEISRRAEILLEQGADILDVGAYSSRPGAADVAVDDELERLEVAMAAVRRVSDTAIVSVDTFRAEVASRAVEWGADIINDISGGRLDHEMIATVARLRVPYVAMHMRGTPADMQSRADYDAAGGGVAGEVLRALAQIVSEANLAGVSDLIVDPGFGFAKTFEQNYELLAALPAMRMLGCPILVGVSRKSMVTRLDAVDAGDDASVLAATSALHAMALDRGADILRVHDVAAARAAVEMHELTVRNTTVEYN